ncbi:MAG: hypothetical protein PHN31_00540 [Candidatus Gracilibacteria bacterium]|nr:hypothetical protein [Candidatus Gracilibacteria bacterium]
MNKQILGIDTTLSQQERDKIQSFSILGLENNFKELVSSILEPQEIEKSIEEIEKVTDFLDNELINFILLDQKKIFFYLGDIQSEIIINGNLGEKFINKLFQKLLTELENLNRSTITYISSLAKTGKINQTSIDKLNKIFVDLFGFLKSQNTKERDEVIVGLIETGLLTEPILNNSFAELFVEGEKEYKKTYKRVEAFIKTGKITNENTDNAFTQILNRKENDTNVIEKILSELIKSGKVSIELLNSKFDDIIKHSINDKVWIKYILINAINTKQISNTKINDLFDKAETLFQNVIEIMPALIKTGQIDEKRLNFFFNSAFHVSKNFDNRAVYILTPLIGTGKIKKEKINEVFLEILSIAGRDYMKMGEGISIHDNTSNTYWRTSVLPEIVKLGIDNPENIQAYKEFIKNFVTDSKNIMNGVDYIDDENIKEIVSEKHNKKFLEIIETNKFNELKNSNYALPELINTKLITKKNLLLLFDTLLKDVSKNKTTIGIVLPLLIELGEIQKEKLQEVFDNLIDISQNEGNSDLDQVIIKIISVLDLTDLQKSKLDSHIISLINSFNGGRNILAGYIKTGKIHLFREKNEESLLETKAKYKENYKLYKDILSKIDGNSLKMVIFLRNNFLNIEKLQSIDTLLNYDIGTGLLIENFEFITKDNDIKNIMLRYFSIAVRSGLYDEGITHKNIKLLHYEFTKDRKLERLPITKEDFIDYMDEEKPLFEFQKDKDFDFPGTKPWTKKWFLEDKKRIRYLKSEKLKTFEKFGTYLATGIIEGSQGLDNIKIFYEHIFKNISYKDNRTNILQLGEVFNLILKQGNYEIFDKILNNGFGKELKDFIDTYHIKDKGRTIVTLMITKEIRDSFQIFNDNKGKEQVDYLKIEEVFKIVQEKLKKYRKKIDLYKNQQIKTSIGLEYEVTESIAKGYLESIGSDYKNDIEIISEYADVAEGNDAVHEIATNPTDNPYLLILEMKLLDDLDFIDLNFKKEDYAKGSRGVHFTVGGEQGIGLDEKTNFIQNILIAGNFGGLNAGEDVINLGLYSTITEKIYNCEILFGDKETKCVEYRSLGIDKKEQFERLIISLFNLNMTLQLAKKHLGKKLDYLFGVSNLTLEKYKKLLINSYKKNPDLDEKIIINIFEYLKLIKDIHFIIKRHNTDFIYNETTTVDNQRGLNNLINLMVSTNPVIELMKNINLSINFFKTIFENELNGNPINSIEDFEDVLKSNGKDIDTLTQRQKQIIYNGYRLRIRKNLDTLKAENIEIYENIEMYLNGNIEETIRKITNKKRFDEVIKSSGKDFDTYIDSLFIELNDFDKKSSTELVNQFTHINNLFIKKDSTNALSMYDTTKEQTGEIISDRRLSETTSFDKLELGLPERDGPYVIQGASDSMLTQAIQKRILEFNKNLQI